MSDKMPVEFDRVVVSQVINSSGGVELLNSFGASRATVVIRLDAFD